MSKPSTNIYAEQIAFRFTRVFAGRKDVRGTLKGGCLRELKQSHIIRHLEGKESLGRYPLLDDGTCYWAAVDFDFGKQTDSQELAETAARRFASKLFELGLKACHFERTKSALIHLWLFFSEPVIAEKIIRILRYVAKDLKLKVTNGEVEIFPKQDSLSDGQVGNYVHLPYYGGLNGSTPKRRVMIDPANFSPIPLRTFLSQAEKDLIIPQELDEVYESLFKEEPPDVESKINDTPRSDFDREGFIRILSSYWQEGQRQELAMSLAGFLLKEGWTTEEAENVILELAEKSGDNETPQRLAALKATFEKIERGEHVKGYAGIEEIVSSGDLKKIEGLFEEESFDPIPAPIDEVLPFPVEVFPKRLRSILSKAAKSIGCPVDFLAVTLLACASTAIGGSRRIEIKPGWTEPPLLYIDIVAPPGTRKSPALAFVLTPFHEIQMKLKLEYKNKLTDYEQDFEDYERDLKAWHGSDRSGVRPNKPEHPIMSQVITTDATVEAFATLLEENPKGLLFVRDELSGWILSMNQYKGGKGADRQHWLSIWSGAQIVVNRKGQRKPIIIDHPFVSVVGCMPPDIVEELTDERGREDGFIHRILFSCPDNHPLEWRNDGISSNSTNSLRRVMEILWELQMFTDDNGEQHPSIIPFSQDGKKVWQSFITEHYKEQENPLFSDNLRGPWAKLEGYAARLALIIHLLRWACEEANSNEVDGESMFRAAALIDYFKSHAKRIYGRLRVTPEDKKAISALNWIKEQEGKVTVRELVRYKVAGVNKASEAKKLIDRLEDMGYGGVKKLRKNSFKFVLGTTKPTRHLPEDDEEQYN